MRSAGRWLWPWQNPRESTDVVLADFEGESYGNWVTEGTAFGRGPARGTLPGQMAVEGFEGRGLVNSFLGGDGSTGTLTSPPFLINRKSIRFLIGGGGWAGATCMNLVVDGQVVRTATGPNSEPGGSERLEPAGWDVSAFVGKTARIQIVDRATGGWGHINVDQIVLTDSKPPGSSRDVTRALTLERRYLHLPVKTGARKSRVALQVDGATVREFEIELSDESRMVGTSRRQRVAGQDGRAARGPAPGGVVGAAGRRPRPTRSGLPIRSTASRCAPNSISRLAAAGTTIRMDWSLPTANIICSSSTIRTAGTGATCTGATR